MALQLSEGRMTLGGSENGAPAKNESIGPASDLTHDVVERGKKGMVARDLARLAGDYARFDEEAPFTASDAISLAHFVKLYDGNAIRDARRFRTYYGVAWNALVAELGLRHANEILTLLHSPWRGDESAKKAVYKGPFEPLFFTTLVNARKNIINFVRLNAGVIEGDPWGGSMLRRDEPRAALEAAREWYGGASKTVLEGLIPIDEAICAMIGWDTSRAVAYEALRREHGWEKPSFDEICEYWT